MARAPDAPERQKAMHATDIIDTGIVMPEVASVRAPPGPKVAVDWSSGNRAGQTDEIDLSAIIGTYRLFAPLLENDDRLATIKVIDGGSAIGWAGADLELAADTLEAAATSCGTTSE